MIKPIAAASAFLCLAGNAGALSLGDAHLRSALGERLLVEIPIVSEVPAVASCFDVRHSTGAGPLRATGQRLQRGGLVVSTPGIVVDPIVTLVVAVRCPGLPKLTREYVLLIDPAGRAAAPPSILNGVGTATRARTTPPTMVAAQRPSARAKAGARYRVRRGDSVSAIAQSLVPPGTSIWPMVDRLVRDNPRAFVDGDADRLLAGAILTLPATAARVKDGAADAAAAPIVADAVSRVADSETATAVAANPAADRPAVADAPRVDATGSLLNVLASARDEALSATEAPRADAETPVDSPFLQPTSAPTATAPPSAAGEHRGAIDAAPAPAMTWTERLAGLAIGGLLALLLLVIGDILRRRREAPAESLRVAASTPDSRAQAVAARLAPTRPAIDPPTEPAAPVAPTPASAVQAAHTVVDVDAEQNWFTTPEDDEALYSIVEDDFDLVTESFTFHTPASQASAAPRETLDRNDDTDAELVPPEALTDRSTIIEALDDDTQQMLEADYEAELTRTQQISKALAEHALQQQLDELPDATLSVAGADEVTRAMPARDAGASWAGDETVNEVWAETLEMRAAETRELPQADHDEDDDATARQRRA